MSVSSLCKNSLSAKLGMVHPEISRRNIIPEEAYLQKYDFKRKRLPRL
jgi:hypothetical protein